MSGTIAGGKKGAKTIERRYGAEYWVKIGTLGGEKSRGGGFAKDLKLAQAAGRVGGKYIRTHCRNGHPYTPDNIAPGYETSPSRARCLTCYETNYLRKVAKRKSS